MRAFRVAIKVGRAGDGNETSECCMRPAAARPSGVDVISALPGPGQQLVEAVDRVALDHALQHIAHVGEGLDAVHLGGLDQRTDHGPAVAAAVAAIAVGVVGVPSCCVVCVFRGCGARVVRGGLPVCLPILLGLLQPAADRAVPAVLDGIVGAAGQKLCDLGPLVLHARLRLHQQRILHWCPLVLLDVGVKLIVPTLADLLARASGHVHSQRRPRLGTKARHQLHHPNQNFGPDHHTHRPLQCMLQSNL